MAFFKKKNDTENTVTEELSDEELAAEGYKVEETTETINIDTVSDATMDIEDEDWEDDEEYEYVTPHYGLTGFLIMFFAIIIGAVVVFVLMGEQIKTNIRQAYIDQGYVQTKNAMAKSEDIALGKTAYVNGELVIGSFVEIDTSNATAKPSDILYGYTAFVDGKMITGTIPTFVPDEQYSPGAEDIKIKKGYYIDGNILVEGSENLKAANIRKGVKIWGITGTYDGN